MRRRSRRELLLLMGAGAGALAIGCGNAPPKPTTAAPARAQAPRPAVPSRPLRLPDRPAGAEGGHAFLKRTEKMTGREREQAILDQVLAGNVPHFLRALVPVSLEIPARIAGEVRTGVIHVTPDYVTIGTDDDFVRMPMCAGTAQRIAIAAGCNLPTRKLVDDVYRSADHKLTSPRLQAGPGMTSSWFYAVHEREVEERRAKVGARLGQLVAGHKKDIVVSRRMRVAPGRLVIYGWFRADGEPIQPLSTVHDDDYVDYAHGVRLVDTTVTIDGQARALADVLVDSALWPLVSDEGPVDRPGYPV